MRSLACAASLTVCTIAAPVLTSAKAEEEGPVQGWSHSASVGVFLTNVSSSKSTTSRDSTIAGTTDSLTYLLKFDGGLEWHRDRNHVTQTLILRYGEQRQQGQDQRHEANVDDLEEGPEAFDVAVQVSLHGAQFAAYLGSPIDKTVDLCLLFR